MTNNITFFLNPLSHNKKGQKNWQYIQSDNFKKIILQDYENAISLIQNETKETAVAVGGDGTINLVLNGIINNHKKMGVLYSGTSPDFCKFHKIPLNPKQALLRIQNGQSVFVDILKIKTDTDTSFAASSCNIGLGAITAEKANFLRKFTGDKLGTFFAVIYALFKTKPFDACLKIDNKTVCYTQIKHLVVFKNPYIASGLFFNLPIQEDDGYLYTIVLQKNIVKTLWELYTHKKPSSCIAIKGKEVYIHTTPHHSIEFDGDSYPITTPITISCEQRKLELIR